MPPDSVVKRLSQVVENNNGSHIDSSYRIEYNPDGQRMVVQFPEANAQYEYENVSKKFMKVMSPRREISHSSSNNTSMFRHVVP